MFNIALNTFRELARNKMLYMIVFFGVALIAFSLVLASLSLGQTAKIVVDFGLAMIEIFGMISVVFIGSQLLFREIEGRTIYLILCKPVPRAHFILGKFLGFAAILLLILAVESLLFLGVLLFSKTALSGLLFVALGFIYLKLLILIAIILFLSTFISPLLSILVTLGIAIIGHGVTSIIDIAARSGNIAFAYFGKFLMIIFPNFEALNIKSAIGTPVVFSWQYLSLNTAHAFLYLAVILLLSTMIFNRKTFEN